MQKKIEKGIPIPRKSGTRKSIFHEMDIGDSVFYAKAAAAYSSATRANKMFTDRKFSARSVDGGGRVWRVE